MATAIALLVAGVLGMLIPHIVSKTLSAANSLTLGGLLGILTPTFIWALVIGALSMSLIIVLRQDELAATIVVAVHLYIDWYLGFRVVALIMVLALLVIYFLARSPRYPWVEPRPLWLWGVFLVLTIPPAIQGGLTLFDTLSYYPNVIFGALIMFWLGTVVARDTASVRRLFKLLSLLAALLALHALIEATTGKFLFASSRFAADYTDPLYSLLPDVGSVVHRLGSFLIDPNYNGTFFALTLFIPLGLFVESSSFLGKVLYAAETVLILLALLLTYSAGAAVAAVAGAIAFTAFAGRTRYRIQIPLFIAVAAIVLVVAFPSQIDLNLLHGTTPGVLASRIAAWQTGLRVIEAFPLTGIGLGQQAYLQLAEPYRVPEQVPLEHPHNSYLEWGAMAGLPVLIVFIALLFFALRLALRNWTLADARTRSLLGGGLAAMITLSVNSLAINGWTLPPLAAFGWLILGALSSPLLVRTRKGDIGQEETKNIVSHAS